MTAALDETCPSCAANSWDRLWTANDHPIARCAQCGLVRTLSVSVDGEAQYPVFDQSDTLGARAVRGLVNQLLRERLAIVRSVRSGGRLLDFGCGSGSFARLASAAGYDTVGLEPFSLGAPTEERGLRLLRGPLTDFSDELGAFDIITLWHVLEHAPDPKALLQQLKRHLVDGALVVSVPNFASWQSRVFRGGWFHLDPPRHITHFDAQTLADLLTQCGFRITSTRTFHWEYGPVGWLQSALNQVSPRPNFLYEWVKDRGALAEVPLSTVSLNLAVAAAVGSMVALPSIAIELAAAATGQGGVLTYVCELS